MAQLNFDATQIAPDQGVPDALPAGYYNVAIDESEIKPTKDGSGSYLQLRFNILDGQYAGRKTFARLNIVNPNPIAQEIGLKQLSAVGHAVNVLHIADSTQLHAIPMQIKLKVRPAKDDYEASNEITGYFAAGTHATGGTTASAPAGGASVGAGFPFQQAQTQQAQTQQAPAHGQGWNQPAGQQPWNQGGQPASNTPAQQPWTQPQGQVQQPQVQQQAPQGQQAWNQPAVQQQQVQQPAQTDWANGQVQQAPAQAQQQVQQQAQAPINQQPAHINVPNGQTAQTMTPPWAQS